MENLQPLSYWKKYRSIRSKVAEHVLAVHQTNMRYDEEGQPVSSSSESDNEQTISDLSYCNSSSISNLQSLQPTQEASQSCPDSMESVVSEISSVSEENEYEVDDQQCFVENEEIFFETIPSSDSSSESDTDEKDDLAVQLAEWATKFGTSHTCINELLRILRAYHVCLPKDARTLLKTAKVYDIHEIAGGSYYYFGISENLRSLISHSPEPLESIEVISLQLNIDGLPLFKSSNAQFWPILGRTVIPFVSRPFTIGLFVGKQKPQDVSEYTQQLIQELDVLIHTGITITLNEVDHHIGFSLACVICDTPARAFIKCCKGHSGYFGCDKCSQQGVWKGKMTFPETDAPRRTDAAFDAMLNIEHHLQPSPFRNLPVGMVSQFPLDYMHLVCLGVMKRLIWLWMKGPLINNCRIGIHVVRQISDSLLGLKNHLPREFSRKGRSIFEVERWKVTEFRQFLLYAGPVILKNQLSSAMFIFKFFV